MQDDKVFFVRPDEIVHDTIEGETVVIDLQKGVYFRFDGAATHAWNGLLERATEDALVDRVAAAYAAPREAIAAEVHAFLIALYRDGIIRREDPSTNDQGAADPGETSTGLNGTPASHRAQGEQFFGLAVERFDQLAPLVGGSLDEKAPFEGMALHRFEDLDELLTIDPVHEVRDEGWPHRQAAD
jgi:hypothetical protein